MMPGVVWVLRVALWLAGMVITWHGARAMLLGGIGWHGFEEWVLGWVVITVASGGYASTPKRGR